MKTMVLAAMAAASMASAAQAVTIFGVDETNNLVTFDSATPGVTSSSVAITGTASSLQALDFRPRNNTLYGLGIDKVIYSINRGSGVATALTGPLDLEGNAFAFDFNPTIDRLRIVSDTNQNYVFNPETNTLGAPVTPVFYAAGDANQGRDPDVTGAAYTSSVFGAPGNSTQLYSIDTANDVLTRQANSDGILTTVGSLGVNLASRTSFDIVGSNAFAFDGNTLYRVNLGSGALTNVGTTDRSLFGIAVAAVPEPATWAMMIGGFGMVGATLRRRRVTTRVHFA